TYFIHQDNVGSATTMTDYTGSVQTDQLFYPWGQKWTQVGTDTETRFASLHLRDSETNLDRTHFRLFSSDEGRWFSPDPKRGCGRNPQNHNRYAYVVNEPTRRIDPRGDQDALDPEAAPWGWCDNLIDCVIEGRGGGGGRAGPDNFFNFGFQCGDPRVEIQCDYCKSKCYAGEPAGKAVCAMLYVSLAAVSELAELGIAWAI